MILEVPGIPVPQPRAKATNVGGHARVYAPSSEELRTFKSLLKLAADEAHEGGLLDCPISLVIECWFPRPKGKIWKTKPMPPYPMTSGHGGRYRGDVDNLAKSVMDTLTNVIWVDDGQVWDLHVRKWVCGGDQTPRTLVWINEEPDLLYTRDHGEQTTKGLFS